MKVFITKHALTAGIEEAEVEVSPRSPDVVSCGEGYDKRYYHKPDWHKDRDSAISHAEQIRASRVADLLGEVARLKALRFWPEHWRLKPVKQL
jgi:hypothetical protein